MCPAALFSHFCLPLQKRGARGRALCEADGLAPLSSCPLCGGRESVCRCFLYSAFRVARLKTVFGLCQGCLALPCSFLVASWQWGWGLVRFCQLARCMPFNLKDDNGVGNQHWAFPKACVGSWGCMEFMCTWYSGTLFIRFSQDRGKKKKKT